MLEEDSTIQVIELLLETGLNFAEAHVVLTRFLEKMYPVTEKDGLNNQTRKKKQKPMF